MVFIPFARKRTIRLLTVDFDKVWKCILYSEAPTDGLHISSTLSTNSKDYVDIMVFMNRKMMAAFLEKVHVENINVTITTR